MPRFRLSLMLLLPFLWSASAAAHDFWIERSGANLILNRGHRSSAHAGEEILPYDPAEIQEVLVADSAGKPVQVKAPFRYPLSFESGQRLIYVRLSSGYWTKTPYGTKNLAKDQARQPLESWLSFESVKFIEDWDAAFAAPFAGGLELVPLENPLSVDAGDKLRLLITYQRRPAAGVMVAYDGRPRGQTGDDGRINIRLRRAGFQLIQATLKQPLDSEKADREISTSALCFYIGERP